jgi:hypothetical protein
MEADGMEKRTQLIANYSVNQSTMETIGYVGTGKQRR